MKFYTMDPDYLDITFLGEFDDAADACDTTSNPVFSEIDLRYLIDSAQSALEETQ